MFFANCSMNTISNLFRILIDKTDYINSRLKYKSNSREYVFITGFQILLDILVVLLIIVLLVIVCKKVFYKENILS